MKDVLNEHYPYSPFQNLKKVCASCFEEFLGGPHIVFVMVGYILNFEYSIDRLPNLSKHRR